jgi:SAM-dependent methyltransferase
LIDYSKIASDYAKHRQVHPRVLEGLICDGDIKSSSKVLEVGCGTGNYIGQVNRLTGCISWGIDPSQQMLSVAKERFPSLSLSVGRAEKLEFNASYFDLVFSVDVIHHVTGLPSYFQEAYRVLKRCRRICTVTDSEWTIRNREPLSVYFPETAGVELKRYPPISRIKQLMQNSGFKANEETMVEFPYQLTDLGAYRARVFSSLHMISEESLRRGVRRMEEDLAKGLIRCVPRYSLVRGTK